MIEIGHLVGVVHNDEDDEEGESGDEKETSISFRQSGDIRRKAGHERRRRRAAISDRPSGLGGGHRSFM